MMRNESDGYLIAFEGIDGAGTTTQADRYAAHLRRARRLVHVTREPSGGPVGSLIRLVLTHRVSMPSSTQAEIMALLFAADRLDHLDAEIAPHLRDGYVVLSDRYDLSSATYQSVTASDGFGRSSQTSSGRPPASFPPRSSSPNLGPASAGDLDFDRESSMFPPSRRRIDRATVEWIRELNRFARRPDLTVVLDVSPDTAASRRRMRGGARELFEDADLQARLAAAYRRAEELMPGDKIVHVDGEGTVDEVAARVVTAVEPVVGTSRSKRAR